MISDICGEKRLWMDVDGLRIVFVLARSQLKVDRIGEAGWLAVIDKPVFEPSLMGSLNLRVGEP
jgi:hypothetical protein